MGKLNNLVSVNKGSDIIISPNEDSKFFLSYLKNNINILSEKDRKEFIYGTEKIIRDSPDYTKYIAELKSNIPGTNTCALFNNIKDTMVKIEMHHGPIFTLAEICIIVLNHYIKNNKDIDSFDIADEVLEDHYDGIIQTVFLSKMAHNIVSNKKIQKNAFISIDHAIGDIVGFIIKYADAMTFYEINKIRNYLYLSEVYENKDTSGIYDFLKERVKLFKNAKPKDGGKKK